MPGSSVPPDCMSVGLRLTDSRIGPDSRANADCQHLNASYVRQSRLACLLSALQAPTPLTTRLVARRPSFYSLFPTSSSPMPKAPTHPYEIHFDTRAMETVDQFALLARQAYNLGDPGAWFGAFRGGYQGFNVRLYAVEKHYAELHAWQLRCRWHLEPEYQLASIFFGLDSALECFVFAMNALGYAARPTEFVDITSDKALRSITPRLVLGSGPQSTPHAAFSSHFSRVTALWQQRRDLIDEVQRQHDVSKHRSTIYRGGQRRMDPPPGFHAHLGLNDDHPRRFDFAPMAEIILDPDPKRSGASPRPRVKYEDLHTLEGLCGEFTELIEASCRALLDDAQQLMPLTHAGFLERFVVVGQAAITLFADEDCQQPIDGIQGVRIDYGHAGYAAEPGRVTPACASIAYRVGDRLPLGGEHDKTREVGPAWFRDPDTGAIERAWWSSSLVYVSPPLVPEATGP